VTYDYGLWWLVAIHVVWLTVFAVAFLRPARRREWRSMGILTGFIFALYELLAYAAVFLIVHHVARRPRAKGGLS